MFAAGMRRWSLRLERAESSRLAWAFVFSLSAHLLIFGAYQAGKRLQWWQKIPLPAWMQKHGMLTEVLKKKAPSQPLRLDSQVPLVFVEVSPAQASPEPPKETPFYSDKDSLAANPQPDKQLDIPKIEGTQTKVVKTEDVPRHKEFTPLQPAPPPPQPQEAKREVPKEEQETKVKPPETPGDLAMAKPEPVPKKNEPAEPPHVRPRTLAQWAQQHPDQMPGPKMKQEGGVKRRLEIGSLDAKGSELGEYDRLLIAAIQQRWYGLLDERSYSTGGKVVLHFCLHSDGRVTDVQVAENTAGAVLGYLCERAVCDPAPFAKWPEHMRRILGSTRNIQFTFYYN